MRERLSKLPSPAMAVAFVALLAALTGTAVALPGSNTVTQGDLVNNSVGKGEIKTNGVGKAELRSNAAGASEVNEGSLGTVPTANLANAANQARTAGAANVAGTAFNVVGRTVSQNSGVNDGAAVQLFARNGFSFSLQCDTGGLPQEAGQDVGIAVENVSAGDDAFIDTDDDFDADFDEGDIAYVALQINGDSSHGSFGIITATGVTIRGIGVAGMDTGGTLPTDCIGSAEATG